MNLRPPPDTEELEEVTFWLRQLYQHVMNPVFIVGDDQYIKIEDGSISMSGSIVITGGTDLDMIEDGTTYSRVKTTDISSGHVLLTEIVGDSDDLSEGAANFFAGASGADFIKAIDTLDLVSDGATYKRINAAVVDSNYIYLLRKGAGATERVEVTASGIEFYTGNTKVIDIANTPSITVGQVAASQSNILISSGAISFRNNTDVVFSVSNAGIAALTSQGTTAFTANGGTYTTKSISGLNFTQTIWDGTVITFQVHADPSNYYMYLTSSSLYTPSSLDFGSNTYKWKDLYLSGNISVDGTVDGVDISSYLDQAVKTTDDPYFAQLGIGAAPYSTWALRCVVDVSGQWSTGIYNENDSGKGLSVVSGSGSSGALVLGLYDNPVDLKMSCSDQGNVWIKLNCSADSFTDRTPFPKDKKTAYDAINSVVKSSGKNEVDHDKLHSYLKSYTVREGFDGEKTQVPGRNLSAMVSAQNEVIKDMISRIEALEAA